MKTKPFKIIRRSVLVIIVFLQSSCLTFYDATSVNDIDENTYESIDRYNSNKYKFIVHSGDLMWRLESVNLGSNLISGRLGEVSEEEEYYYNKLNNSGRSFGRFAYYDEDYIYQVHIYAKKLKHTEGKIEINEEDVTDISIFNRNGILTASANIGTLALIGTGAMAVFLAVVCNCPHVYTFDGTSYNYDNTLFTGAISPKIERSDYKLMPDYLPNSSNYRFLIKNEQNEHHYTNLLELKVIQHPEHMMVLSDQKGNLYSIKNKIEPLKVVNENNETLSSFTKYADDYAYSFNCQSEKDYSDVFATFSTENVQHDGKLILSVKNSPWGAYVYNEFSKKLGWYHERWVKKNQNKTGEEMYQRIKKQGIPLIVSVRQNNEWVDIEEVNLVGEVAFNSIIVPIDKKYLNRDKLEIRLRTGFLFWNIDHMAMDFSENEQLEIQSLKPNVVSGKESKDFTNEILLDDTQYMILPEKGDSVFVEFNGLNFSENKSRTIILHSKGYYLNKEKIEGKLQFRELARFRKEGEMSRYSKELYNQYFKNLTLNFY